MERKSEPLYEIYKCIGKGQFGEVRAARNHSTGQICVCKSLKKGDSKISGMTTFQIQSEMIAMSHVDGHPNIVRLLDHFEDEECVHLVMEMCSHGDLFSLAYRRGVLEERVAAHIISQLAGALNFCHKNNLVHRDVKPENVLISGWTTDQRTGILIPLVKLADFGSASIMKPGGYLHGISGTFMYMAPEIMKGLSYSPKVDIWSLGVLLFASLTGLFPFHGDSKLEIAQSICYEDVSSYCDEWTQISPLAVDLICWMLQADPRKRATAEDVANHPWVLQYVGTDDESSESDCGSPVASLKTSQKPGCFFAMSYFKKRESEKQAAKKYFLY